ncbi:MAG: hypothetical protein WBB29_20450 [Geitlerinemataceae cyanobacterium]
MKFGKSWNRSAISLGLLSLAASVLSPAMAATSSIAESETPSVAQNQRDLCRQVYRDRLEGLAIYQEPSPYSLAVGGVGVNQQVTLVADFVNLVGPDNQNWIQISAPVPGYISNGYTGGQSNLVYCSFSTTPDTGEVSTAPVPEPGDLCRRVTQPKGLAVRLSPDPTSAAVGGVGYNETVQLDENLVSYQGPDGRVWIPIVSPISGYISSGYGSAGSNLGGCS